MMDHKKKAGKSGQPAKATTAAESDEPGSPTAVACIGKSSRAGYLSRTPMRDASGKYQHQPASGGACLPRFRSPGCGSGHRLSANRAGRSRRFTPGPGATANRRVHSARGRSESYSTGPANPGAGLARSSGVGKAGSFGLARSFERDAWPSWLISRTTSGQNESAKAISCFRSSIRRAAS